jgi:alpha-L-fucosidase
VDVSIRPGWFYHAAEDEKVRTGSNLLQLYVQSVGRNAKLLLNVPPTPAGVLGAPDVAALMNLRRLLDAEKERALRQPVVARIREGATGPDIELTRPTAIDGVRLSEAIEHGQAVARYRVSGLTAGGWRVLSRGSTIGYAKIDAFPATLVSRARLDVEEALDRPSAVTMTLLARDG